MTESGQKMSLLEAYEELKPDRRLCSFGKIIQLLDADDQIVLAGWLADKTMTSNSIAGLVTHAGHTVHRGTVADHRKGVCRCSR